MNKAGEDLSRDRANRKAARSLFDARVAQVKADLEARSVGGRLADKASEDVLDAAHEALAVAKESKGIIAATLGALLLWLFRNPLIAFVSSRLGRQGTVQDD